MEHQRVEIAAGHRQSMLAIVYGWLNTFAPEQSGDPYFAVAAQVLEHHASLSRARKCVTHAEEADYVDPQIAVYHSRIYGDGGIVERFDDLESGCAVYYWPENNEYTIIYYWNDVAQVRTLTMWVDRLL